MGLLWALNPTEAAESPSGSRKQPFASLGLHIVGAPRNLLNVFTIRRELGLFRRRGAGNLF